MKRWYFLSPLLLQKLIWIPTRLTLLFFGHLEVRGFERLKKLKTNAIFAVNHSSESDPILLPASLPFFSHFSPIFYTSREQSFYKYSGWRQHFYGGNFFKAWGAYPVQVGLNDYARSMANHIPIILDGGSLCIFPEGKKTRDGLIQPAKGGVAYLAYATGRPIVPVRYDGTYQLRFKDFIRRKRRLKVTFGEPIYITGEPGTLTIEDFKKQANLVMDKIRDMEGERSSAL